MIQAKCHCPLLWNRKAVLFLNILFQDYNLWVLSLFQVCRQHLRWQERKLAWGHRNLVAKSQLYQFLITCVILVKTFKLCELVFLSVFIVFNSQIHIIVAISKGHCENQEL